MTKIYAGLLSSVLCVASFSGSLEALKVSSIAAPKDTAALFTALKTASHQGDTDATIAKTIPTLVDPSTVNQPDPESKKNYSLLYYAVVNGWPLTCTALIKAGADLTGGEKIGTWTSSKKPVVGSSNFGLANVPTTFNFTTSLFNLVSKTFTSTPEANIISQTAKLFTSNAESTIGKSAVITAVDTAGNTPLFYQAAAGNATLCTALIKAGVPVNAQNEAKHTALDIALDCRQIETARAIITDGGLPASHLGS